MLKLQKYMIVTASFLCLVTNVFADNCKHLSGEWVGVGYLEDKNQKCEWEFSSRITKTNSEVFYMRNLFIGWRDGYCEEALGNIVYTGTCKNGLVSVNGFTGVVNGKQMVLKSTVDRKSQKFEFIKH